MLADLNLPIQDEITGCLRTKGRAGWSMGPAVSPALPSSSWSSCRLPDDYELGSKGAAQGACRHNSSNTSSQRITACDGE
jgi:hypothetical protein